MYRTYIMDKNNTPRPSTEFVAKPCQKFTKCLDTMILSTAKPETNIFTTSPAQPVLAFVIIIC